ncbi:transposase [Sphingobacterium oryzagri]|uniref:transposase n=1 Tax=Sphingobacterium oryzagri TaxID=3025669 RepID=UPI003D173BA7
MRIIQYTWVNLDSQKELINIHLSENEGARFWLSVRKNLKQGGVEYVFIACLDGLKGFPDAIGAVYPKLVIYNSVRYLFIILEIIAKLIQLSSHKLVLMGYFLPHFSSNSSWFTTIAFLPYSLT